MQTNIIGTRLRHVDDIVKNLVQTAIDTAKNLCSHLKSTPDNFKIMAFEVVAIIEHQIQMGRWRDYDIDSLTDMGQVSAVVRVDGPRNATVQVLLPAFTVEDVWWSGDDTVLN